MYRSPIRGTRLIGSHFAAHALRRVLENASILTFASLLVMSLALGRYTGALVWTGALLVFFAQAWEARAPLRSDDESPAPDARRASPRHFDVLRWLGVMLALGGVAALTA